MAGSPTGHAFGPRARRRYFTNVLITRVSWWLTSSVQRFLRDIDASNHIFLHRWVDAPIQTTVLNVLAPAPQVGFVRIDYSHASTADEIKKLRGELARLKMSNEVLTKELHKMKTLVGAANPAADGAGVDVDALASKRELESIRVELSKLRRQGSQDHEALRLEVQQIKRALAVQKAMAAAE